MTKKNKKITYITSSCVNCPFGKFYKEMNTLRCRKLKRDIEPSGREPGAIYYHNIPEDCPYPDTDEEMFW